jgi:hypothetical protein
VVELRGGDARERRAGEHRRVVHQDVESPERAGGARDQRGRLCGAGEVGAQRDRARAERL